MQLALFHTTPEGAELLPGSMRTPRLWDRMCSWCGAFMGYDGARDATWNAAEYRLITWAKMPERVCPFCCVRPTELRRAIEIARELRGTNE